MKLECELKNVTYDYAQKGTKFEFFTFGDEVSSLTKYLGKKVNVELKNDKRTIGMNGYFWSLLGELQSKLRVPKEELYRHYIYECGAYEVIPIRNDAVDRFIESWGHNGLGWVCDTTKSKLEGYTNVLAYYGTSTYTKEEMSVLLDQIIQDCIEQDIPTKKKEEIESLLEEEYGYKN